MFLPRTVDSVPPQAKVQAWLPRNMVYLHEVLHHEAPPPGNLCNKCKLPAVYYCSGCDSGEWMCRDCLLLCHVEVVGLGSKLITVRVLQGPKTSRTDFDEVLLPRITFKGKLHSTHTLCHQQFPLTPAYASTFHSCQGLTLDCIGVDLTQDVFTRTTIHRVVENQTSL